MRTLFWKSMRTAEGFLRPLGVETRFLAGGGENNGAVFAASSLKNRHDYQFLKHGCQRTMSVKFWYDENFLKLFVTPLQSIGYLSLTRMG